MLARLRASLAARVLVLSLGFALSLPVNAASQWHYTALGDSVAVGLTAFFGYVLRYDYYVSIDTSHYVTPQNLAQLGWKSADLASALQHDVAFRLSVARARVITWDIGGNDLLGARDSYRNHTCGGADNQDCLRATVSLFEQNWDTIVNTILHLRNETPGNIRHTIIRTMDIYDPFVAIDKASKSWKAGPYDPTDFEIFKPYLDAVNQHIAQSATQTGFPYAPVYAAFNGTTGDEDPVAKGYISFDGLHPNDTGHEVIASLLRALGYAPLYAR